MNLPDPRPDGMSDTDFDALVRSMDRAARDPDRAEQLQAMLATRPWAQVARFASYVAQTEALRLRSHERPPIAAYVRRHDRKRGWRVFRDQKAGELLDRMLAAGLSQFEPDPIRALELRANTGGVRRT